MPRNPSAATAAALFLFATTNAGAVQTLIEGPVGSASFGTTTVLLPHGNFVVVDPFFDQPSPAVSDVGAVHLYRADGVLISTLKGSTANDRIGSGGITVLANGNFVVSSPQFTFGASSQAGAATFVHGSNGLNASVSSVNSLIGDATNDQVGARVTALDTGDYVVASPGWSNGANDNAGAVTFGSGTAGVKGIVGSANSLVGTRAGDQVGFDVQALPGGRAVVNSPFWDNVTVVDAGAVTPLPPGGLTGAIGAGSSLVGTIAESEVGSGGVKVLPNGHYVVVSPNWSSASATQAGAVTHVNPTIGTPFTISLANSLIGGNSGARVGGTVFVLANGNYVLANSGFQGTSGAVTFANGTTGLQGVLSSSNSLVGFSGDQLGNVYVPPPLPGEPNQPPSPAVVPLPNGDYLVTCPAWDLDLGTLDVGAVAYASGTTGLTGFLTSQNALTGTQAFDRVGQRVYALASGNYVVASEFWNGAGIQRGAITFAGGNMPLVGTVTAANSLVGTTDYQSLGKRGVTVLDSGGYLVYDPSLKAVAFGSPTTGRTGVINSGNALIGNPNGGDLNVFALANGHYVVAGQNAVVWGSGSNGVFGSLTNPAVALLGDANNLLFGDAVAPLGNGRYVVGAGLFDNGGSLDVGALALASGTAPFTGPISASNAQIGATAGDRLTTPVHEQPNGKLVAQAPFWDHNGVQDVGATFLLRSDGTSVGVPVASDVVVGATAGTGGNHKFAYDTVRNQLLVGQPSDRRIIALKPGALTITTIQAEAIDPSGDNQPVPFSATVASGTLPSGGRVIFRSSNGETCTDTTPTSVNGFTVEFGCSIVFTVAGTSQVWAEFVGAEAFAYSRSANESHTTTLNTLFKNGFE